ncbi:hypothetical protein [Streptomyces sp. NPDC127100]|uniref:hypothetical protein n=1 Tax=Streptomyces sp. NPDC127100 TaxID=3347138 RepID=UPI003664B482
MLLASTACSSAETTDSAPEPCAELLGPAGVDWVRNSGTPNGPAGTSDLEGARKYFYEKAGEWEPGDEAVPTYSRTEVCKVLATEKESPRKHLTLGYGPSLFPFDFPFAEDKGVYDSVSVVPVNSDVELVTRKDDDSVDYSVYVKCRVPGAPAGQETGMPIEGTMTDTLTGDTDVGTHLTHLLHSARVVVKEFDCRNKPSVPTRLPAG